MKLRNKLIATIVSISMVLAVIGVGAWASTESFTATITNTVNLEFDNIKGQVAVMGLAGADDFGEEIWFEELFYDGSNIIYDRVSIEPQTGTNYFWDGTGFLDSSDDGLGVVGNTTEAAALMYVFVYEPTEDCVGASTISIMIDEINKPEIAGGDLKVKYFASVDAVNFTEIASGEAITPIRDNEMLAVVAVCQYYNIDGVSISTVESAWDFSVTFSAGRNEVTPLTGTFQLDMDTSDGVILPYNYTSPGEPLWEIIEFGEYPQTLKANDVTITSDTPDEDGYYLGSDGERYYEYTIQINEGKQRWLETLGGCIADDGTKMTNGETYYFKVEPIKWRVLSSDDEKVFVVTDKVIKFVEYQASWGGDASEFIVQEGVPEGTYVNNYYYSTLRSFLTGAFYNQAFTDAEKQNILLTNVDNSAATTISSENPYVCQNTEDYVFALSYADVTNPDYKFNSDPEQMDTARLWGITDYAKATGALEITEALLQVYAQGGLYLPDSFLGYASDVCTRSPAGVAGDKVSSVGGSGVNYSCATQFDVIYYGTAPAMYIVRASP